MSYWLVAAPTRPDGKNRREEEIKSDQGPVEAHKKRIQDATGPVADVCTPFRLPALKTQTLDVLMSLSDKLGKIDTIVEAATKKTERAYYDIFKADPKDDKKDEKEPKPKKESKDSEVPELKVSKETSESTQEKTASEYIQSFEWNQRRYPIRKDLGQIADSILEAASKADDQLKKSMSEFQEVKINLTTIERRESGTLMVKPLGQFFNEGKSSLLIEKEWITTLIVVVPYVKEKEWLAEYEILEKLAAEKEAAEKERREKELEARKAAKAAAAAEREKDKDKDKKETPGAKPKAKKDDEEKEEKEEKKEERKIKVEDEEAPPAKKAPASELLEKKDKKNACPNVVPGSAVKLTPDGYEGEFCLYRILVFRKGADIIKNLCREKRYTVRPFKYDPEEESETAKQKKEYAKKLKKSWEFLIRFTKTTYSDLFSSWIHIKAMRVFVEGVLRFGLPVDFQSFALMPKKGQEPKLRLKLKELYKDLPNARHSGEMEPGEVDPTGVGEFYPYVYFAIKVSEGNR